MAGVYLSMGFIAAWTAVTIRRQGTLVYLIALGVAMAAVGLPEPANVWIDYLVPELVVPIVLVLMHRNPPAAA